MAFLGKPKSEEQYGRLMGMIAPEATPSKRVGTEAPVGSVAAGPKAGQAASEFTKSGQAPGAAFGRQLKGADIGGITRLAEQPLLREAGQEATRVAQEGIGYKTGQQKYLSEQPQFKFGEAETPDLVKKLGEGDAGATETAQKVFAREKIDVPEFEAGDIKEFTPLQALRGGSVESLLRKEAAGPYSTGMAGLDALLFQKKGGAADLATKGIALRTAEQATADALEKKLTEEARKEAGEFVTGQKEQLSGAIKGGLTAKEKAYMEGVGEKPSKIEEERQRLQQQLKEKTDVMTQSRDAFIKMKEDELKNNALDAVISKLRQESIAAQESAGRGVQGDVTIRIPSRDELVEQAKSDPRYLNALRRLELQTPYFQQKSKVQAGAIPELGLQNVISPEDAAQYNRLQNLIGGAAITPTQAQIKQPTYNINEIMDYFNRLKSQSFI
jgi:hypothetical protein